MSLTCLICTFDNKPLAKNCEICLSSLGKRKLEESAQNEYQYFPESDRNPRRSTSSLLSSSSAASLSSSFDLISSTTSSIGEKYQFQCKRCHVDICHVSPPECEVCLEPFPNNTRNSNPKYQPNPRVTCYKCGNRGHYANNCPERKNGAVDRVLLRDDYPIDNNYFPSVLSTGGIIEMLQVQIMDQDIIDSYQLCSPLPHISQVGLEGSRWSCGYRNLQMMCCAMMEIPCLRRLMFDGKGEVPDIHGMQSWIEKAWGQGFDVEGAAQLGYSLLGSDKWIGTTECATLLHYFGIDARIVDFESRFDGGTSDSMQDHFKAWIRRYFASEYPVFDDDHASLSTNDTFAVDLTLDSPVSQHHRAAIPAATQHQSSSRLPIYFQHDGHSRTIIGYEVARSKESRKKSKSKRSDTLSKSDFKLLVFDPSSDGKSILYNLQTGNGRWKQQLKRGIHTLNKSAYQVMYIAGTLSKEAKELSKTIGSYPDHLQI